jgi:hypothetical protein
MAHQYLDQLDERLQRAILGNVGTLIAFRIGVRDAKILADEFFPEFSIEDLVSLPRGKIYVSDGGGRGGRRGRSAGRY